MSSKLLRLGTLGILYFVQGAPYGFQSSCLPIILRQAGLSFTQLGVMKLLFLPWVCKPLYAPFVDGTMTKQFWLVLTMTFLGITCFAAGLVCSIHNIISLSAVLFLLNLFSAAQDIAVDSLAVRILQNEEELGIGNTIQVVAYKAGSIFAGGILLYLEHYLGWSGMFNVFASIYLICILLITYLNLVERAMPMIKTKNTTQNDYNSMESLDPKNRDSALHAFFELFKVDGTIWMVCFVMFYKLCERAEQTFSMYLVDKHVPTTTLAAWSTILKTFSLAGSTYAGFRFLRKKSQKEFPAQELIVNFGFLRAMAICGQFSLIWYWGHLPVQDMSVLSSDWIFLHIGFSLLCCVMFCAGTLTSAVFTLMMRLSQTAPETLKGTHYTTLATFEVLGKLTFAAISGYLIDNLGLQTVYLLFVVFGFVTVPLIMKAPAVILNLNNEIKEKYA